MNVNKSKYLLSLISSVLVLLLITEAVYADRRYRVRSADRLERIVDLLYPKRELTKPQIMVGILARNPKSFKGGNINFLLKRKRLVLPDESKMGGVTHEDAKALLSQHAKFFRSGVTGSESLIQPPVYDEQQISILNIISSETKQQSKKISKLEKDRTALNKRLKELSKLKKERDHKIQALEEQLKNTRIIKSTAKDKLLEANVSETKKLTEENKRLQKELVESRRDLEANKKAAIFIEQEKTEALNVIKQNKSDVVSTQLKPVLIDDSLSKISLSKLLWIIPLLMLLVLAWFFFKRGKIKVEDEDLAGLIATNNEDFEHNQQGRETLKNDELEMSVKLDVARAYVEAGDKESAVDILNVILRRGSSEERHDASIILNNIRS